MEEDKKSLYIKVLKGIRAKSRETLLGKSDLILKTGDIVFDEVNNEYGIILGIKPIASGEWLLDRMVEAANFDNINFSKFPDKNTCILLTLWENKETGMVESRVRYTNSRYLSRIEKDLKDSQITDLDFHCQNECFMECSKECSLWKYRSKPAIKT